MKQVICDLCKKVIGDPDKAPHHSLRVYADKQPRPSGQFDWAPPVVSVHLCTRCKTATVNKMKDFLS